MRSMVLGLVAVLATATFAVAADSGRPGPHHQRRAGNDANQRFQTRPAIQ